MRAALAADVPLAEALQRVYDRALALYFADAKAPLGCFLIGTAATEAARDSGGAEEARRRARGAHARFEARFRGAEERRDRASADPALLADMAAAVLYSLALRARAGDRRAALRAFSRSAVALHHRVGSRAWTPRRPNRFAGRP